jgi:hypothetical protein
MMKSMSVLWTALFTVCFLETGCQEAVKDAPELSRVKGVVKSGDQPVSGAMVTFYPDTSRGNKGPSASATTNNAGEFVLICGMKEGAVTGFHKVTVECLRISSSINTSGPVEPMQPCVIAPKFSALTTTTLTAEVPPFDSVIELDIPTE